MKKPLPRTEQYHTNMSKAGDRPACVVCGQVVKAPRFWVRLIDGGSNVADEAEPSEQAGDLGEFPVGAGCRRTHGLEAVTFSRESA